MFREHKLLPHQHMMIIPSPVLSEPTVCVSCVVNKVPVVCKNIVNICQQLLIINLGRI